MKIIIVDDDCLVAGALKTILEVNEDVEVLATGADGKEACELYERYEPDVLLMDIRMEKTVWKHPGVFCPGIQRQIFCFLPLFPMTNT